MIVKQEELAKNYTRLSLTLESQDYNGKLTERLKEQSRDVHLKGFRKGKVPTKLIYKLIGKPIKMEILTELFNEKLSQELKKLTYQNQNEDLKEKPSHFIFANPLVIKNEINEKTVSFQDDFLIEINIAHFPYEQINFDNIKYPIDKISVLDEDIEYTINSFQLEFAKKEETIKVKKEDLNNLEKLESENPKKSLVVNIYSPLFHSKYISNSFRFRSFSQDIQEKILKAFKEKYTTVNTETMAEEENYDNEHPEWVDIKLSLEDAEKYFYLINTDTPTEEKENTFTFTMGLLSFQLVILRELNQDFFQEVADKYKLTNDNHIKDSSKNVDSENKENNQEVNENNESIDSENKENNDYTTQISDLDTFKEKISQLYKKKFFSTIENSIMLKKTFKKIIESQNISTPEGLIEDIIKLSSDNNKTKEQKTDEEKKIDMDKQKKTLRDTYNNNIVMELLSKQLQLPTFDQKVDEEIFTMLNVYNPGNDITKDSPEFEKLKKELLETKQDNDFRNIVYKKIENDLENSFKEIFKEEKEITLKESKILLHDLK